MNRLTLKSMLQRLTSLYYAEPKNMKTYYQALQECQHQVLFAFPGMTVVLAEVADRDYAPTMTHVLAPETAKTEHTLGWHDFYTAALSFDDGKTALWDIASLEVKQDDGTWLSGVVEGTAQNGFFLASTDSERQLLRYGDVVRDVTFREKE